MAPVTPLLHPRRGRRAGQRQRLRPVRGHPPATSARRWRIADRLVSGKVHINEQTVMDEANAPFGGMKSSGNGSRIGGAQANLESFTELQWLTMRPDIAPYPF